MKTTHISLASLLLTACGLKHLEAIVDKYEAISASTVDSSSTTNTTTADSSSGTTDVDPALSTSTGPADTSTGGAEAGMSDDTGTSTTAPDSSTGMTSPTPFCGDATLDPGEECDDGNTNETDGCKQCWRDRIVFATSEEYPGFQIGGLFVADQRCRMLAALAGLPNFATYRAWLSDSTTAAADRILHSKGRYVLVNGLVVAKDWDALISGTLDHPIDVTEKSETSVGSRVWTGTLPNGQPAFGSTFCNDWDTEDDLQWGGTGLRTQLDGTWSYFDQGDCGSIAVLYCFEN